jgi:pyridoxal phosphate phosphatase PHOSPHO2
MIHLQVILSDANTHFIEVITEHHGIASAFACVHTNGGTFSPDGRLVVTPHHTAPAPHGCLLCPPNLCKGSVLEALRLQWPEARIIYVGDGGGDYCPATRLAAADLVLARHVEGRRPFGLWDKLGRGEAGRVAARCSAWATGEDLYRIFAQELGVAPQAAVVVDDATVALSPGAQS